MKDLIKTTEGAIVIGGLVATVLLGKVFAIITGVAYAAVNIPNFLAFLKKTVGKGE
ncbi:MAG: hypothetical protein KUG81_06140 [Gammaproteobacteria bacterium]|nr:hypothetical protein [Gammaproteobacteria bacterium]